MTCTSNRWGIEAFLRMIKSWRRLERRQLETARRISSCLAVDMAWHIHYLTMQGHRAPEMTRGLRSALAIVHAFHILILNLEIRMTTIEA